MKLAVLTGGGVAPGMNAAVRAVARTALARGWEVAEVDGGFGGLIEGNLREVEGGRLTGLMRRGGTVLGTGRSQEIESEEGQERAVRRLAQSGVEALVVIGGGGSLAGALSLSERDVTTVGIPATIDNDIPGTELSIGVDTAVNTAVEAIDRIRGTAISHNRAHLLEVMGRGCGYLALMSAIGGGAEAVLVPEFEFRPDDLIGAIEGAYQGGRSHFIVVVAEGAEPSAERLREYINDAEGAFAADLTSVGHIQSGGDPSAYDRILAARLGAAAVAAVDDGASGVMVGADGQGVVRTPLEEVVGNDRPLDPNLYRLAHVLSGLPDA